MSIKISKETTYSFMYFGVEVLCIQNLSNKNDQKNFFKVWRKEHQTVSIICILAMPLTYYVTFGVT